MAEGKIKKKTTIEFAKVVNEMVLTIKEIDAVIKLIEHDPFFKNISPEHRARVVALRLKAQQALAAFDKLIKDNPL
jgi:hypothetical protein